MSNTSPQVAGGGNFPPAPTSTGAPFSLQFDYVSSAGEPASTTAAELLDRLAELEAAPTAPGPRARTARTAVQALLAFLAAVPAAWAALVAAGVDVEPQVAALIVGIPSALFILISAAWNAANARQANS